MTPEQHRDHAELVMREYLLDLHDITEVKDYLGRSLPSEDAATVVALIRTANVEITWPDPCPACGVIDCTLHPTWTAEKATPEVPEADDGPSFEVGDKVDVFTVSGGFVVTPAGAFVGGGAADFTPQPGTVTRVGYSETVHTSGATLLAMKAGIAPVTTVADPGGLLSGEVEPEMGTATAADMDLIAEATGGGIRSREVVPEYDEERA